MGDARDTRGLSAPALEVKGLGVYYGHSHALRGVDLPLHWGHRAHAVELMAKGAAYHCFCSPQQLEDDRQAALRDGRPQKYVGRCRDIARDEARRRVENGVERLRRENWRRRASTGLSSTRPSSTA